jgi:hypothetical protein
MGEQVPGLRFRVSQKSPKNHSKNLLIAIKIGTGNLLKVKNDWKSVNP